MLKTTWAYSLKREDLVLYLNEFKLETSGTVEELRKRWAKFIGSEHDDASFKRLMGIQAKYESSALSPSLNLAVPTDAQLRRSPVKEEHKMLHATTSKEASESTHIEVRSATIDQIRRWGIKFNGTQDPLEFIERLEELSQMYSVSLNQLPSIMPEFLCERGLVWFRNNNEEWKTWAEFKRDFCDFFLENLNTK